MVMSLWGPGAEYYGLAMKWAYRLQCGHLVPDWRFCLGGCGLFREVESRLRNWSLASSQGTPFPPAPFYPLFLWL